MISIQYATVNLTVKKLEIATLSASIIHTVLLFFCEIQNSMLFVHFCDDLFFFVFLAGYYVTYRRQRTVGSRGIGLIRSIKRLIKKPDHLLLYSKLPSIYCCYLNRLNKKRLAYVNRITSK
jgi:hypothetical protein